MKSQAVLFISSLPLSGFKSSFATFIGAAYAVESQDTDEISSKEEAYLNSKSIISFVSDVTAQNRQDVLDSTLLAQLAANHDYPGEDQILNWYKRYTDVLTNIGWEVQNKRDEKLNASQASFDMENVILSVFSTALQGSWLEIIKNTLSSIKSLSRSDNKISVFQNNTHTDYKGAFQVSIALEENNSVSLHMAAFVVRSTKKITDILFFKFDKEATTVDCAAYDMILNADVYAGIRDAVKSRLGELAKQYIVKIDL